jgi:hypothetical protein
VGHQALFSNTTGINNTALGWGTLGSNTTGSGNTSVGFQALSSNTTGGANIAIGSQTLHSNQTGFSNTAVGENAMSLNTVGRGNTALGSEALAANTTGNNNIAIGDLAAVNVTGSNNIHIGSQGTPTDNGAIRIGGNAQSSFFAVPVSGVITGSNNAVPVLVDSNGQLGTVKSSQRFKEDIQDMGDLSRSLLHLRPVIFRYKKPFDDGSKPIQYGLVAEEVAEVFPDLIARSTDGQIETVKYQMLDVLLLNELQRQEAEIRALKERLDQLEFKAK